MKEFEREAEDVVICIHNLNPSTMVRAKNEIVKSLRTAYNLGLERAAEIADDCWKHIIGTPENVHILAEKYKSCGVGIAQAIRSEAGRE